jgi:hypothetical protein
VSVLVLSLALASWSLPEGVDAGTADLVDRIVEEQGGFGLAEARIASLLESLGHDPAGLLPADERRRLRWLPSLVLRVSWAPSPGSAAGRREVVLLLAWPLE